MSLFFKSMKIFHQLEKKSNNFNVQQQNEKKKFQIYIRGNSIFQLLKLKLFFAAAACSLLLIELR